MFGSYSFNMWPPDDIGKPQESDYRKFVHMDFSYTNSSKSNSNNSDCDSASVVPEYWYYATTRHMFFEDSPCEVYRVNVRERIRSPERIGHVQLGGMIDTGDRLWLDRSCANFYGICIYPGLAEDGTVTREGAYKRFHRGDLAFGPEDGPVRLLRLIRNNNTLQRMDMALAGEPIKIGEWEPCTSEYRWHFHFMSDNEAILLVGESEIDAVTHLRLFLRTHVYHLHIDTGRSIAFATKIDFPVPIEQPDNHRLHRVSCPVSHSDQIFVHLIEEDAATNKEKHQKQKMLPLFYRVDMHHKCLFFNDANSSWERWDDDTSADSPIPPGKYYFQRVRFDKGLLLLNYIENCYVQLQIWPLERRCTFKRFFRAQRSFWPDREGIVFGETTSDDRLFLLYRSPPVIWPLKLLSFWKLTALLDEKGATGGSAMVAKIWKFFSEDKTGAEIKRKCLKCGELLMTPKDRSTSNMINHLKTKNHEDALKWFGKCRNDSKVNICLQTKKIPMDVCTRWNSTFLMLNTFYEMKNALLKTDDYLREISDLQRRPTNFSQNEWNNLKRLAENLEPLGREDFVIIGELCKVLKVFHVETCRAGRKNGGKFDAY
uniref:BED-type domain-containing protein n=1 Tax=Globodera rostochiensis TaxID=31243 RepID=A0A914HNP6_GLORO